MSWYEQSGPPTAGWYPDPSGHGERWWDGSRWTEHYHPPAYAPPRPQPPAVAAEPPASSQMPPPEFWVAAVAMVVLLAGSVGPWVTIQTSGFGQTFTRDISGLRGAAPGVITLLAGFTGGVLLCVWLFERAVLLPLVTAAIAAAAAIVAVSHVADPASGSKVPDFVHVSPAWGAWASLVAATALFLAAVALAVRARTSG